MAEQESGRVQRRCRLMKRNPGGSLSNFSITRTARGLHYSVQVITLTFTCCGSDFITTHQININIQHGSVHGQQTQVADALDDFPQLSLWLGCEIDTHKST